MVTTGHNGSQRVTKWRRAQAPAHSGGHRRSQNGTGPRQQGVLAVTGGHQIAQGPSASVSGGHKRSQNGTGPRRQPARPGGHSWSQNCTGPRRQRALAVTGGHKVAQGLGASAVWRSQALTKWHRAQAPMRFAGHRRSQNGAGPRRQCVWLVTGGHKMAQGLSASAVWRSQAVTKWRQVQARRVTKWLRATASA